MSEGGFLKNEGTCAACGVNGVGEAGDGAVRPGLLILTSHMGYGHLMAARNIEAAASAFFATKMLDPFKEMSGFWHDLARKIHLTYMEYSPGLWAKLYRHFNNSKRLEMFEMLQTPALRKKLARLVFSDFEPKVIVSTHPMWGGLLRKILTTEKKNIPLVAVVTDSISIHRFWQMGEPDYFVVANEDSASVLRERGVLDSKIKILGFPVSPVFWGYVARRGFWEEYGLSSQKKTLLFIFASAPPRHALKLLAQFQWSEFSADFQALVVVGNNLQLKEQLEGADLSFPHKILGWTDQMPALISESAIVVTKAGGSTTMECIAARKPMIITHVLPGQEEGNARLIEKYKIGVILGRKTTLPQALEEISGGVIGRLENFDLLSRPNAATDIVKFLKTLV